jgi:hypothetical protein
VVVVVTTGASSLSYNIDGNTTIFAYTGATGRQGDLGPTGPQSRTAGATGATGPTGVFQTGYSGTISASAFNATTQVSAPTANFGTINLNGYSFYQDLLDMINNLSVSSLYIVYNAEANYKYFHWGTFTAPTNGVVLKLNLVACSGFNINNQVLPTGVMTQQTSQIYDLCVYFYTSNGDKVNLGPTVLRGFGWCTQTHTVQRPMTVYVTTTGDANTTGIQDYDFYAYCDPYIGSPMITAATTGLWRADPTCVSAASLNPPANAIKLPGASVNTSLTTNVATVKGGI